MYLRDATLVVGTVVPLGMILGAFSAGDPALCAALLVIAGVLVQLGNFYSKYCVLKAAMFAPTL